MSPGLRALAAAVAAVTDISEPPICDACDGPYEEDTGCSHDGRQLCASCVLYCPECLAAAAEAWREDHPNERGSLWP